VLKNFSIKEYEKYGFKNFTVKNKKSQLTQLVSEVKSHMGHGTLMALLSIKIYSPF